MSHRPGAAPSPYAAIVLAGGAATRMAGRHKPSLPVAGIPMLDRVLAAVPDATHRVVVGPPQSVPANVLLTREDPPGGGPAAALAAGLALLPATPDRSLRDESLRNEGHPDRDAVRPDSNEAALDDDEGDPGPHRDEGYPDDDGDPGRSRLVAVLAGDQALLTGAAVRALRRAAGEAPAGAGGAVFVDGDGREQWLCGVWRIDLLRERVAEIAGADGTVGAGGDRMTGEGRTTAGDRGTGLAGMPVRRVLGGLGAVPVRWAGAGLPPWFDCDTDEQVAVAEAWLGGRT